MEIEDEELARLVALESAHRLRYLRLKGGPQEGGLTTAPLFDADVIRAAEALWREAEERLRAYKVGHGQ